MTTAILKSPQLSPQAVSLAPSHARHAADAAGALPLDASAQAAPADPRVAMEVRLREEVRGQLQAQLQAEFDARIDEAREAAQAEGYKQGLASGHEEGTSTAQAAFRKKQALLEAVLASAEEQVDTWLQSVSAQALSLAREAVCDLLGEQALDAAVLSHVVQRLTTDLRRADVLAVRMHPTEAGLLRQALRQGGDAAAAHWHDRLVDDLSMEAGGVVLETPRGERHATLDVLLRKLLAQIEAQREALTNPSGAVHALRA